MAVVLVWLGLFAQAIVAGRAMALAPDGRGLELVTPSDPAGASVNNVAGISPDGNAVVYFSLGPFPDAGAGDVFSYNQATRGSESWTNTPIGPAYKLKEANLSPTQPVAFSQAQTTSLWLSSLHLTPDGPPEGRYGVYRRSPDGSLAPILALGESEPSTLGASADTGHYVFADFEHLLPSDADRTSGSGIYELAGSTLREVDVGATGQEISNCGAATERSTAAVSESGERIVFTSPPACGQPQRVYIREGGTTTVEASASRCTRVDCNEPQDVTLVGATPSDSAVFMVTSQQLTNEDEDSEPDLYRYDLGDESLTLLTPAVAGATGEVLSKPVRPGADGSLVYFYARGRLLPGIGSPNGNNLYVWDAGKLRFLASLGPEQPLQTSRSGRYALLAPYASLSGAERERSLLFEFNGADTTAGSFGSVSRIAVDQSTGSLYVLDNGHDVIDKFTAEGAAAPFASTGTSSLTGAATPAGSFGLNGEGDISVDNSGTASQGRLYVNAEFGPVDAFAPDGSYLWQLPAELFLDDCGTAVDSSGHLWVDDWSRSVALEYATSGSPPQQIGKVKSSTGQPCRLNFDRQGNLYFNIWESKVDRYANGSFASNLDPEASSDVWADQSTDNGLLFSVHRHGFGEFEAGHGFLGATEDEAINNGVGIAYNPQRDWVYVADAGTNTIKVYGPPAARPATDVPVEGSDQDGAADVYRYDATANRFRLLSAGPGGGNQPFGATFSSPLEVPEFLGPKVHFRAIDENGERAWFTTTERLVPEDQNEAEDVYEWDAGQIYLVSGGAGSTAAQFAGGSANGASVLFRTTRTMLPADRDGGEYDVYAARLGGGFTESQPGPECPQEPCQRQPAGSAPAVSPATARGGERKHGRIRITGLPKNLVAKIIDSGRTSLTVHAPAAGLVAVEGRAGKALVASGRAGATRAGSVSVVLAWTAKARAALSGGAKLKVRLRVSEGGARATRQLTLRKRGGR
jgi:DNA-binding beta-propeller fold protein YncE